MTKDLLRECELPAVIVSLAGLGAIHHTVSTVSYAEKHRIEVIGLIFNYFDPENIIHSDNVRTIQKIVNLPVIAKLPTLDSLSKDSLIQLAKTFLANQELKKYIVRGAND
jgi:dethiobiotin synthetase